MARALQDLEALTQAIYQSKQAELEPILAQEARLRRALAQLDQETQANGSLPVDELTDLQRVGGDMAWRRWAARSRAELHNSLARVLAQKANKIAHLRSAFGKAEAVSMLKNTQEKEARLAREKAQLADVEALIRLSKTR
jgi:hypothetical protein